MVLVTISSPHSKREDLSSSFYESVIRVRLAKGSKPTVKKWKICWFVRFVNSEEPRHKSQVFFNLTNKGRIFFSAVIILDWAFRVFFQHSAIRMRLMGIGKNQGYKMRPPLPGVYRKQKGTLFVVFISGKATDLLLTLKYIYRWQWMYFRGLFRNQLNSKDVFCGSTFFAKSSFDV